MTLNLLDSTDAIRTDIGLTMAAMGARGELVPRTEAAGFGLAVTSDVLVVSTTWDAAVGLAASDADVSRLRLGLDGATPQGGRLGTEAAWGFPAFGGRYTGTPYLGLGLTETGRDYRFGWRLGVVDVEALQLAFGLEGTRRESNGRPLEHGARLLTSLRW